MKRIELNGQDIRNIVTDDSLYRLGFTELSGEGGHESDLDVSRALDMLRGDSQLAARLLSYPDDRLFWKGASAGDYFNGATMGVRIIDRGRKQEALGGIVIAEGDNVFGEFLTRVRDAYRKSLSEERFIEEPMREGQVVSDFLRIGAQESDIENDEMNGARYIHTEPYSPASFRHDAALDGTSGHARRASDSDVVFHSFECPFGTGYRNRIKVGSEAEASYLYEQAIRGDLDWNALFDSLYSRGLLDRSFSRRQRESLVAEMKAQFAWMREQISNDPSLRDRRIVTSSLLVEDESMGRSIYDYDTAPSPGHILARYINNPLLLYRKSENSVIRALAMEDRRESVGFHASENGDAVRILVMGSDIIGGRIPGRRGTSKVNMSYVTDEDGRKVIHTEKSYDMPLKSRDEIEADYAAFSQRIDSILAGMEPGVKVEFVTGGAGRLSSKVGLGTPRMIERYVRERNGVVSDWNFSRGQRVPDARSRDAAGDVSLVRMEHLYECLPVLTGSSSRVSFRLDGMSEDSEVDFGTVMTKNGPVDRGLRTDCAVCFSMDQDRAKRDLLMAGSYAASAGMPVVHVMGNQTEEQQRIFLGAGALISMTSFSGSLDHLEPLFLGDLRTDWNIESGRGVNLLDGTNGYALPIVSNICIGSVPVDGIAFHSVQGAFVAMMAKELGGSYADIIAVARAEDSHASLCTMYDTLVAGRQGFEQAEEMCMRRAVRQMLGADSEFARRVLETGEGDLLQQSSAGGTRLFADIDGRGENRFGIVLAAERDILRTVRAAQQIRADEERNALLSEASRLHKASLTRRAEGEKVKEGLPSSIEAAGNAVWFIGTAEPLQLTLPEGTGSFGCWDDDYGSDRLVREKAASPVLSDGEGGTVDNNYVFIFRSTLDKVYGRKDPYVAADSQDLTGLRRKDPRTGLDFECAFGLAMQYDDDRNEKMNDLGRKCSYFLDTDIKTFRENLINTDTKARTTAISHGMQLCMPARSRSNGTVFYPMSSVFKKQIWGSKVLDLVDPQTGEKVYMEDGLMSKTRKSSKEAIQRAIRYRDERMAELRERGEAKGWMDNPHASEQGEQLFDAYTAMLERGERMPLNIVSMPSGSYDYSEGMADEEAAKKARVRFLHDFNFTLELANSLAIAQGVPLRFPLDGEGRIDLGPGVPEEFRSLAEQKIDSFIGVVRQEDIISGELPSIVRLTGLDAAGVSYDGRLQRSEANVYMKANDLARAFGLYDFDSIARGGVDVLHRMTFSMDGDFFELRDSKTTMGMEASVREKYLRYSLDDERRFLVYSSDPDKIPAFVSALKAYVERAKNVTVKPRLLASGSAEAESLGTAGLIHLQDSADFEAMASDESQSGRTADALTAFSRMNEEDGAAKDPSKEYFGKVLAKDVEDCYVQIRGTFPDGTQGGWHTVEDKVKVWQIASELTGRRLKDVDEQPEISAKMLEFYCVSEAIRADDAVFRRPLGQADMQIKADDKVVSLADDPAAQRKTVNVFAGTGENAHLSNFAVRPFGYRTGEDSFERFSSVEQGFQYMKSFYADIPEEKREEYRRMVLATTDGAKLRTLGRTLANFDAEAWDRVSDNHMSQMVLYSFLENPDAARNLVATGDALITHTQESGKWGSRFPQILMDVRETIGKRMAEEAHMFVTYYGSKTVPENAFKVQISGGRPKDVKMDYEFKETYPDYKSMVERYHKGEIDDQGYTDMYQKILAKNKSSILARIPEIKEKAAGRDVYFFCYERPGEFCHRYLLNNFLNENGIECRENPADRLRYSKGHIPLYYEDLHLPFETREFEAQGTVMEQKHEKVGQERQTENGGIVYTVSSGGYGRRTYENANADGVTFTLAFAVDFNTAGEKCTARAAGDSLVSVDIPLKKDGGIDLSPASVSRSVNAILAQLPGEFTDGEEMGVNIAGNGIYTMSRRGVTQDQCDTYLVKVLSGLQKKGVRFSELRSGGQTGIDESGIAAGLALGIPSTCHGTRDWAYRNEQNIDVRGESSFKRRFEQKDIEKLRSLVRKAPKKEEQKKASGPKV